MTLDSMFVVLRELAIAAVVAPLVGVGLVVTFPIQLIALLVTRKRWSETEPHAWLFAQWDRVLDRPYLN